MDVSTVNIFFGILKKLIDSFKNDLKFLSHCMGFLTIDNGGNIALTKSHILQKITNLKC